MGASLIEKDKYTFDEFIKRSAGFPNVEDTQAKPAVGGQLPTNKPTLYEYYYDKKLFKWVAWDWVVPVYNHDPKMKFSEILVATVDTLRTAYLLNLHNQIRQPILLVGETGTSKTAIISTYLRQLNPDIFVSILHLFTSRAVLLVLS